MTTVTTLATAAPGSRTVPPVRFIDTVTAEWTKLTSLRSTYVILGLGVVLALGMSALLGVVIGYEWDNMSAAERADFNPAVFALFGFLFSQIAFAVLGVLTIASEYSSGMIRLTLAATPRRGRVLLAKLCVVAAVTLTAGLATAFGMFFVGQAVFGVYDVPVASLTDDGALRAVLGAGAGLAVLPMLGACLAVLLRSAAGTITTILALTFVPQILGGLLPVWWQENVISALPGAAMESILMGHLISDPMLLAPLTAALILAGWLALAIGGAFAALRWRDA